jgi:hypothetical protein
MVTSAQAYLPHHQPESGAKRERQERKKTRSEEKESKIKVKGKTR